MGCVPVCGGENREGRVYRVYVLLAYRVFSRRFAPVVVFWFGAVISKEVGGWSAWSMLGSPTLRRVDCASVWVPRGRCGGRRRLVLAAHCPAPRHTVSSMRVHRCRFLDHVPHAIESVDVEPVPGGRLAVLRANADIEVWSLRQGETHCEFRIAGAIDTPVRRVAWGVRSPRLPNGRLFTCGLHGLVTEWDLRTLSPRSSWDSLGGAAWTMTVHAELQLLAVGCEDGGCSIFDLSDEGLSEPPLLHRTPPQGGRLLSVAFSPQGSHLACSAADGSVRIWHVSSWQALSRYVLESDGRRKPPLVWSVLLLSDLTVVSGDSTGHVSFYDGRHGTLVRRFASHQADILALAVSADESRVFASGVDQKVVCFTPQPTPPTPAPAGANEALARRNEVHLPPPPRGWLLAFSRRPHTHDVRALTTYEPQAMRAPYNKRSAASAGESPGAISMLVSGGIDTQLCLLPLGDFERAAPLKLLPFPQRDAIGFAREARLLLSHDTAEVNVWQLPPLPLAADAEAAAAAASGEVGTPRKLLLLRPKLTARTISCAAISDLGQWLVVCDAEVRLYKLTTSQTISSTDSAATLTLKRVALPEGAMPAACCAFSPDERLLLLGGLDGLVQTVTLEEEPIVHTLRGTPDPPASRCAIVQICLSPDAQWVATTNVAHRVHVHSLDGLCFSSAVPALPSPPTALAFLPATSLLAIASASKQLTLYDVDRSAFTAWSVRHAAPLAAVAASPEVPHRIAVNPARPLAPILCSQSWLCRVDVDGAPATSARAPDAGPADGAPPKGKAKRKRAAATTTPSPNGDGADEAAPTTQVVRNYGGMLLFSVVAADEAVVVEQPWLRVMDHFPPALYKHRFGS